MLPVVTEVHGWHTPIDAPLFSCSVSSLAASPSPPGRSRGRAAKWHAVGREGLANFARHHIFLEC